MVFRDSIKHWMKYWPSLSKVITLKHLTKQVHYICVYVYIFIQCIYKEIMFSAALNIISLFMPELLFKLCKAETATHSLRHYTEKKRNVVLFPNCL